MGRRTRARERARGERKMPQESVYAWRKRIGMDKSLRILKKRGLR